MIVGSMTGFVIEKERDPLPNVPAVDYFTTSSGGIPAPLFTLAHLLIRARGYDDLSMKA